MLLLSVARVVNHPLVQSLPLYILPTPLVTEELSRLSDGLSQYFSAILVNNDPQAQEQKCWRFGYANEKP